MRMTRVLWQQQEVLGGEGSDWLDGLCNCAEVCVHVCLRVCVFVYAYVFVYM